MNTKTCNVEDCHESIVARQLCNKHYQRWRKHGDPSIIKHNPGNRTSRPVPVVRTCSRCSYEGPAENFVLKTNICFPCKTKYQQKWRQANPELVKASRQRNLPTTLEKERIRRSTRKGIDPMLVDKYRKDHSNTCDICGKQAGPHKDLSIDHNHDTKKFRGILCNNCNNGLGRFQDNIIYLEAAIRYLQSPPADILRLRITPKN